MALWCRDRRPFALALLAGLALALLAAAPPVAVESLVRRLGSDSYAEREAASAALDRLGAPALPVLRRARQCSGDAEVRRRAARLVAAIERRPVHVLAGHRGTVTALAFFPDGRHLLSAGRDNTLRVWSTITGTERRCLRVRAGCNGVRAAALTPAGERVVFTGSDGMWLCDARTGKELRFFPPGRTWEPEGVALSPDGGRALAVTTAGEVLLWDLRTGRHLHRCRPHPGQPPCLASPFDGRHVVTAGGGWGASLSVWDVRRGTEVRRSEARRGRAFQCAAVSPSKDLVLTGGVASGLAGEVTLWELPAGKEVRELVGHTAQVNCLAFLPGGKRALSGSHDQTVRLWDVQTGEQLRRYDGHEGTVWCVAASPDGRLAATAGDDGLIRLWPLPP
jgi:WD40 repeat protein